MSVQVSPLSRCDDSGMRSTCRFACRIVAAILCWAANRPAWPQSPVPQTAPITHITLAELVEHLPEYLGNQHEATYIDAVDNASPATRDAVIPGLLSWAANDDPKMRGFALLTLYLLYLPSEQRAERPNTASLPTKYLPTVVAHLRDPDPGVRRVTLTVLTPTMYTGTGYPELVQLLLPLLKESGILTEAPDPFFTESDKAIAAQMPPAQRQAFLARPHKIIKMPAEGTGIFSLLLRAPSITVDDALIAFLDRQDQTISTIGDCLHSLALSSASERINDEALRRTFELHAMTIYLLQFVTNLRLTPAQLTTERERLIALSNDPSAHPALRRSAHDVAACWDGDRHHACKPSDEDLIRQEDTK